MASAVKAVKKSYLRVRKFRTTDALQRLLEEQLYLLSQQKFLQEGQKGYVEGEDTDNPEYVDMPAKERLSLRMSIARELRAHLPIHEAEQELAALEAKLMQLVQLIEQRAPYLLAGDPTDFSDTTH